MGKRKIECSLNALVIEYLKRAKYENTSKLIARNGGESNDSNERMCEKFMNYLKKKEAERENKKDDDLRFAINFGAYQHEVKVLTITSSVINQTVFSSQGPSLNHCFLRRRKRLQKKITPRRKLSRRNL